MFTERKLYKRGELIGDLLIRPFKSFASLQAAGGILILLVTLIALWWINSGYFRVVRALAGCPHRGRIKRISGLISLWTFLDQ